MTEIGLGSSLRTLTPKLRTGGMRYVDIYRSDDYEPDGSQQRPYKSLQEAIDAAPIVDIATINSNLEHITTIIIGPGTFGNIVVDRPICINGETAFLTRIGNITLSGGFLLLRNADFRDLDATEKSFGIIIECNGSNITFEEGYLSLVATAIWTKLTINAGELALYRESNIHALDVVMDGDSVKVDCKNSTITTFSSNAAHDEEVEIVLTNSLVENAWTMEAQEKVVNINSVLVDAVITAAGSYEIATAGPAIPVPEEPEG